MGQEMRIQSKIIISKFTGNYIQENAQDFICVLKKKSLLMKLGKMKLKDVPFLFNSHGEN